ncbi:M20/M25/M40 family metallo-hydrolase [Parasphingopyxis lamellibrachiae]|uniref:Acetylornithine deacetylase/succinyl-diaminopimelate desuccinylase-like protein n=1 Tax=Parasphingopyxis lamellibrachiae TaxID=680125 RepID=A0A3D9FIV4_9SPHN|nr:M20/M25/M40 family metallo-hydrolase [Parasphingopyxis lamellibrachiae]RED17578.1 acetylornithine deacetylase/succinyl-diaminopimelate desuccinylase-like protein [Parasphingopyxis lamellibrachiae]
MRLALFATALLASTAASAQTDPWHERGREIYRTAIEIPTVAGRGQMAALVSYLQAQLEAAGIDNVTVHDHADTQSMVVRWPAANPSGEKAILLLAHMDVVEALPEDWSRDPFTFIEEDGYFYGRGTADDKQGVVALTTALLRLRAEGFAPTRDIILVFTGDEETTQQGAELAASEWIDLSQVEMALNADAGGGAYLADGTLLGFGIQTAEKIYQTFTFTATNPGGHSSRPRPDNAIYDLAHTLGRLEAHRFEPMLNETTRAYFTARAATAEPEVRAAIERWLADPSDGEAADIVEASPTLVGTTRTRCVATRLQGGHADNALPQMAQATVNCRMFPGVDPASVLTTLREIAAPSNITVEPVAIARPTDASPLREDVITAFTQAVHARHPGAAIVPNMSTGATDGLFFRAAGIPTYGVNGAWIVSPEDERAHGRDERLPVQSLYDNIDHWTDLIRALAD